MARPSLLGIVVRNMEASLHFYRLLGVDIPENAESEQHVEVTVQGGFRIAWDTQELIKKLYPDWIEPVGHGMALAFECDNPTEVDALYNRIVQAGYQAGFHTFRRHR